MSTDLLAAATYVKKMLADIEPRTALLKPLSQAALALAEAYLSHSEDKSTREELERQFRMKADIVYAVAMPLVIDEFGERCRTFDAKCECCRRWKLLDDLLENPHVGAGASP